MKRVTLLMASVFFAVSIPVVGAVGGVSININVPPPPSILPPPPPLPFATPPDIVVVPSGATEVYLVPNTVGLYFHGGYWYRFHGDHWFRASLYSGPWGPVEVSLVPRAVVAIPPNYILSMPPGYHRIHYVDFNSHWRDWGRTHYWNSQPWYRDHALHHWGGREVHAREREHHEREHHEKERHEKEHRDAR